MHVFGWWIIILATILLLFKSGLLSLILWTIAWLIEFIADYWFYILAVIVVGGLIGSYIEKRANYRKSRGYDD